MMPDRFFNRGLQNPVDLTTGITAGIATATQFVPQNPNSRGGAIAGSVLSNVGAATGTATGIAAAAGAANAVPIAGQIASAGLALGALFTRVFAGRRRRRREEARRRRVAQGNLERQNFMQAQGGVQQVGVGTVGSMSSQGPLAQTVQVQQPQSPSVVDGAYQGFQQQTQDQYAR